jgi:hypothetical protein
MRVCALATAVAFAVTLVVPAFAESIFVPSGTEVPLIFDTPLNSRTAHEGDIVRFHVAHRVMVEGRTVIARGTPVTGVVTKIDKATVYGVGAKVGFQMNPIRTIDGQMVDLGFKNKSKMISSQTGAAAGTTVASTLILGPIGLIGGLFFHGKSVNEKPGDHLLVTVAHDTTVHI